METKERIESSKRILFFPLIYESYLYNKLNLIDINQSIFNILVLFKSLITYFLPFLKIEKSTQGK